MNNSTVLKSNEQPLVKSSSSITTQISIITTFIGYDLLVVLIYLLGGYNG